MGIRECLYPFGSSRSPREVSHWPFVCHGHIPEPITVAGGNQCSYCPGLGLTTPLDLDVGQLYSPKENWVLFPEESGWMLDRQDHTDHCPWVMGRLGNEDGWGSTHRFGQHEAEEQNHPTVRGVKTTNSH